MKKPLFFLWAFVLFSLSNIANAQIISQDNFDSYISDSIVDPQSTQWVGWGNAVTSAYVSDDTSSSPNNSLKIWNATVPGSTVPLSDVLHLFNDQTTGRYKLEFKVFVPSNANGSEGATYWNVQHVVDPLSNTGLEWAFDVQIHTISSPSLSTIQIGGTFYYFQAVYDQWVDVVHIFDLDRDQHDFYYDGKLVTSQPFSYQTLSTTGTKQLAALDLFANCDGSANCVELGYFDDFVFKNYPHPPNDAGVLSVDSPLAVCAGNYDVYATISNFGSAQINQVTVNWEVNGVAQTPLSYSQLIDTINGLNSSTAQVLLGNAAFQNGANTIKVYTSLPNGAADTTNFNDTITMVIQSGAAPQGLTTINTTSSTATLMVHGSTGTFDYEYGSSGFVLGNGTMGTSSVNPFTISGLPSYTNLDIYIRNTCGASTSSWIGPISFMTTCAAIPAPLVENFNATSTPACWTESGDNSWDYSISAGYGATAADEHTGNGGYAAWMDGSFNVAGDISSLTTVPVDISTITTPELNYWVFYNNVDDNARNLLEVEFFDGANWNLVDTIQQNLGASWVNRIIDLSTYTITGPVKVRFTVTGSMIGTPWFNDILLDDIKIWKTPTCFAPFDLGVTNITQTSADLIWVDTNSVSSWEIEYGPAGFAMGNGTSIMASTNPYSLTGLTPNTSYEFYIRTICGPADSSIWAGPFNFVTPCVAVNAFPYVEDFDGTVTNGVWNCWKVIDKDGGNTWNQASTYISPHSSPYTTHGMGNNDDMLISPQFSFSATPMWLKLWDIVESSTYNNIYSVLVSTTGNNVADFTDTLATYNVVNTVWTERTIDLTAYANQDIYIALWQSYSGATFYGFGVDDFTVENRPSCVKPSDLAAANLTDSSADLSWTENNIATEWVIEYGAFGFAQGSGIKDTVTSKPFTINGLSPNTEYEYYVRSVCGRNDSSFWAGPFYFITPCLPVSTFPYTENFDGGTNNGVWDCWKVINKDGGDTWTQASTYIVAHSGSYTAHGMGNNDDMLISPQFALPATPMWIKLWDIVESSTYNNIYSVLVSTTGNDVADFTDTLATYDVTNETWTERNVDLSAYANQDIYVALWQSYSGATFYGFGVDDFVLEEIPSCFKPDDLAIMNLTATTVDMSWTEINVATEWVVEYGTLGFVQGSGVIDTVTTNPYSVSGLAPNTEYEYYVRSICGRNDSSAWAGPFSFVTPCVSVVTYPYLQDFTSYVPSCWDEAGSGTPATGPSSFGASNWLPENFLNNSANSMGVHINIWSQGKEEWIISEAFDLSVGSPYELRLEVGITDYNNSNPATMGSDDQVQVLISTDGGITWSSLYTWDVNNQPTNSGSIVTIPLTAYSGTNNTFAIWATEGAVNDIEDYDFHIDNFEVRITPSCLEPTTLSASNITGSSADLSWVDPSGALEWEIEYGLFGFTPGSGTKLITSTNPITLTGLMNSSSYEYYVRAICAPGDTSYYSRPYSFPTNCGVLVAPTLESFTVGSIPNCWTESAVSGGPWIFGGTTNPDFGNTHAMPDRTNGLPNQYTWVDQSSNDVAVVLETPDIDVSALTTPSISFWIVSHNNTASVTTYNKLYVEAFDGTNYQIVDSVQGDYGLLWKNFIFDLSSHVYNTNMVKLRFRVESGGDVNDFDNDILLDDVAVIEAPSCFAPSGLSVLSITDSSAVVDWVEPGLATIWSFEYGAVGFALGTGIADTTTTKPLQLENLQASTEYEFYVRSVCGRGDTSFWAGPFKFITPCVAIDAYPHSEDFTTFVPLCWDEADAGTPATGPSVFGSSSWVADNYLNNLSNSMGVKINLYWNSREEWILSEIFDLSSGGPYQLQIEAGVTDWLSTTPDNMGSDDEVVLMVSTDGGITWTSLYTWDVNNQPASTGTNVIIPLTGYTGSSNIFAIWATDGSVDDTEDYDFHIDNFSIDYVTGTEDVEASLENISIYPNPSQGIFNIVGNNVKEDVQISIYNFNGKLVYQSADKFINNFDERIDISDLAKGMYFVKLQSKSSMEMKKIVLQ